MEGRRVLHQVRQRTRLVNFEVLKDWIDPVRKNPKTIHHQDKGAFMVAGETIKLPSRMK